MTRIFTIPTSPETAQAVYDNRNSYGNDSRKVQCVAIEPKSTTWSNMIFEFEEFESIEDFASALFFIGLFAGDKISKSKDHA